MNLKELFWSGGGMVLVLLSLIEVSPIKINPWSRLAKIIGHALNAEVLEQQKQTQKKLEEHIQVDDERNANLLRTQILRFNDELIDDKHHTRSILSRFWPSLMPMRTTAAVTPTTKTTAASVR